MQDSISNQLIYNTVRIECALKNGSTCTGTGFFYSFFQKGNIHIPTIVTNKHVIKNASVGKFLLHNAGDDGKPDKSLSFWVQLDNFEARWVAHPDPKVDLCVLAMGPVISEAMKGGKRPFYKMLDTSLILPETELDNLDAIEDVVMVGYPNGFWDSYNNMPICRRGITATHPAKDYNGLKEFVIDAACFPGSSGSPVLLYNYNGSYSGNSGIIIGNRIKLLGILWGISKYTVEGEIIAVPVPTATRSVALSGIPINLGHVIKASRLKDFESLIIPKELITNP